MKIKQLRQRRDELSEELDGEPTMPEPAERRGTISQVTSRPAAAQHLSDLARLRRVRDRKYAQPRRDHL